MGVACCGHCLSVVELMEATGTTHLVASNLNFASRAISCPSSPTSLEIERTANVVAITIQRLSSARNRPGQILDIHSKLVESFASSCLNPDLLPNPNDAEGWGSPRPIGLGKNRSGLNSKGSA